MVYFINLYILIIRRIRINDRRERLMNYSRQRESILKVLRSTDTHPTVEWIYEKVKEIIPNISLGTIYRNLKQLKEQGSIMMIHSKFNMERFDGNNIPHTHLICNICGNVSDYKISEELDKSIRENAPIGLANYDLSYYCICYDCLLKKNSK
jgi:Fe2+ or Zn2+ uptake regulation protein